MKEFNDLAEALAWAKARHPNRSLSVRHLEGDRFVVVVQGHGEVLREVIYVRVGAKGASHPPEG